MSPIENRRYLSWSGLFLLSLTATGWVLKEGGFGITQVTAAAAILAYAIAILAVLLVVLTTTYAALWHSHTNDEPGWFWVIVFTGPLGAYLYGYLVAAVRRRRN